MACVVPIPDAAGIGVVAPVGELLTCSPEVGAVLIAAGVAVDGSEWVPPPAEFADLAEPRGLPVPLP
jgi:hypothetical protein